MDQRVKIQQKFYNSYRVIKLHDADKESVCFVAPWIQASPVHCTRLIEIQILFVSRHF